MADKIAKVQQETFNPFTPEFGKVPAYFAGREQVLSDILSTFEEQTMNLRSVRWPTWVRQNGASHVSWQRGVSARMGGGQRFGPPGHARRYCPAHRGVGLASHRGPSEKRLTGVSIAGIGGATWSAKDDSDANWRTRMNGLLDRLSEVDAGLLITVDEVDVSLDEMSHLVSTYQHFVRENRKVALVMAGLPFHISSLLSGKSTSFLRRAQ